MHIFFLAILIWAVQLKALPSNISLGHGDKEMILSHELTSLDHHYPWGSKQPFLITNVSQTACEPNDRLVLNHRYVPDIEDCIYLRSQIADGPGVWYIRPNFGWRLRRTKIAEYKTCELSLWVSPEKGFFFGSGDALIALDGAILNKGNGTTTTPNCDSRRNVKVYVYHSSWPFVPS